MVRRRGGGTGQGEIPLGKRQATTPVGAVYKDQRRNITGEDEFENDEEEWTQVAYNKQRSPQGNQAVENPAGAVASASFASVAASGMGVTSHSQQQRRNSEASMADLAQRKRTLDRVFVTPAPDGAMRDDITVEVQTMNGRPFKGSITIDEARNGIFAGCMDLNPRLLHGIRFRFSTFPVIKYKLKQQINLDDLHPLEYFIFKRQYTLKGREVTDTFECKIVGIRSGSNTNNIAESDPDPSIRWVKIEWAEYSLEEGQMLDRLELYGERAGELTEDLQHYSDSDADLLGSGTYSIKMRLRKEIPQLIPMWGRRIRIYYRGVQKLCTNCFGPHPRRNCRSERVTWIQYCLNFMEKNPEIPQDYYGKWWKIVNQEFGEIIPEQGENNVDQQEQDSSEQPSAQSAKELTTTSTSEGSSHPNIQARIPTSRKPTNLSREEENNLSEYIALGMSITEARESYQKEMEMAELKLRIRENQRNSLRGAIRNETRTKIGPTASYRGGGRGGLSFN
jgi:hypothetical protein